MEYFKINDDNIEKYNVTFNKYALDYIKEDAIRNCSEVIHKRVKKINNPMSEINPEIENIKDLKIENINEKYSYSDTSKYLDLKIYDYKYIKYPNLVVLLNKIINRDDNDALIYLIDNYEIEYPYNYDKLIENKKYEIEQSNNNFENMIKLVNECKKINEMKELNINRISTSDHYKAIKFVIKFDLIDKYKISDIERFYSFFDNYEYNEEKVLKRRK